MRLRVDVSSSCCCVNVRTCQIASAHTHADDKTRFHALHVLLEGLLALKTCSFSLPTLLFQPRDVGVVLRVPLRIVVSGRSETHVWRESAPVPWCDANLRPLLRASTWSLRLNGGTRSEPRWILAASGEIRDAGRSHIIGRTVASWACMSASWISSFDLPGECRRVVDDEDAWLGAGGAGATAWVTGRGWTLDGCRVGVVCRALLWAREACGCD